MGRFATTIFSTTQRCNVGTIRNNVATMLQRCVALSIVVENRLVYHHLKKRGVSWCCGNYCWLGTELWCGFVQCLFSLLYYVIWWLRPSSTSRDYLKRESARGLHVEMLCSFFICCFNGDGGEEVPLSAPDSTLTLAHTHGMMCNVLSLELTIFIELSRRRRLLTKPPFKITGRASQKRKAEQV